jgi:enoyl-CoA hydratase/carnithine racemase
MNMSQSIQLEDSDGVAVLSLKNGENRFNLPFVRELDAALDGVFTRGAPLVITGDGKFFSNGLDLQWIGDNPAEGPLMFQELHRLYGRLLIAPVPTAAAINGHAFGAGAMLAASCDVRLMREDRGYFCFPEIDLNLTMTPGMNALCQTKFTKEALHEGWTTGQRFVGADAKRLGFVHDLAPETELVRRAADRLRPSRGKDAKTLSGLKRQLHEAAAKLLEA